MEKKAPHLSSECLRKLQSVMSAADFRSAFAVGIRYGEDYGEYWLGDLREFPAASTIKIAILLELYRRFANGDISPEERVVVREEDVVEGGILCECGEGREFSWRELARLMMIISDNTASNIILDRLTMASVNACMQSLHMRQSEMRRKFMEDPKLHGDNVTTAIDLLMLIRGLDEGKIVAGPWREEILDIMHRQMFIEKIPAELPGGTWFANKVGELDGVRHDVAIVVKGDYRLHLVALTEKVKRDCDGDRIISELAKIVYDDL